MNIILSLGSQGVSGQTECFGYILDKRNRMSESRTAANVLLGRYIYNERGLRVKAERFGQPKVQVVRPNGGENLGDC